MKQSVPFLDLSSQHGPLEVEILETIKQVIQSNQFIMGPWVKQLEQEIAGYCGTAHAIGVSSGTDALLVSLMALDIRPGDRVMTTTFSFFATAGVIERLCALPVFCDIDPETYNLDAASLEAAWERLPAEERSRVRAVIPVHLFGQCAGMDGILAFANQHKLAVIEDAAQSLGAAFPFPDGGKAKRAGAMGDLGCISFFPTKNLGAFGDAGMVVTNDDQLAERVRILRVHGSKPKYYHKTVGGNFRLDSIQAAVLSIKLKELDRWHEERRMNAETYRKLFKPDLEPYVKLPVSTYEGKDIRYPHIYNQFVIRCRQRDALQRHLSEWGVGNMIYYPVPLHRQECFAWLGYGPGSLPHSEKAADEVLALPIYPGLAEEKQAAVVEAIEAFYRGAHE